MEANSIYNKIDQKAQLEAQEILQNGEKKAKALEAEMIGAANEEILKQNEAATRKNQDLLKTKLTQEEQMFKQRSLLVKKQLLNQVFDKVQEKFTTLQDEDYILLVTAMMKKETLQGNETIQVAKKELDRFLKLFSSGKEITGGYQLDKLAKFLNHPEYRLVLSKTGIDIAGGFYIIGENFDIDNSYEALAQQMKEKYESEVAASLFNDGE